MLLLPVLGRRSLERKLALVLLALLLPVVVALVLLGQMVMMMVMCQGRRADEHVVERLRGAAGGC